MKRRIWKTALSTKNKNPGNHCVLRGFCCGVGEKVEECLNIINNGSGNGVLIVTPLDNSCLVENLEQSNTVPTLLWKVNSKSFDLSTELEKTKIYFNELLYKIPEYFGVKHFY